MKIPEKLNLVGNMKHNLSVSIVVGVSVMLLSFGIIAEAIGYTLFSSEFTAEYSENAARIAQTAESYINHDEIDSYLERGKSFGSYFLTDIQLTNLCNKTNAQFIYYIIPSEDYNNITFIFNCVNKDSGFEPYEIGYVRETTNEEYKEKYRRLMEGESTEEIVVRDQGVIDTGAHITAMISMKNSDQEISGIICVQRQMDALTNARRDYIICMVSVIALLVIMSATLFSLALRRRMIMPLRVIVSETKRFAAEPSSAEMSLSQSIDAHNEMGQLAESIDLMEIETLQYIENLTKVTAERQRIGTELSLASAIQQGMLNSVSPGRPEFDIYATMDPAKEVGGDFYDFFMIDDDHLAMVIADVSGKGVPAALFMAISKIVIADTARMMPDSPAEALRAVNERICANNKFDMFVSVWLGILEISTGTVKAANAGHEYPAIYRDGKAYSLYPDKHGLVIGGMQGMRYKEYEFRLAASDSIFLYTDGLAEATDKDNELFGTDRMLDALNISPGGNPREIIAVVRNEVDEFVGEADQFDDLTMMCIKYYGPDGTGKDKEV